MSDFAPSKIVDLEAALDLIEDGMTIGIGGWIFHSQPMALIRGIVRRGLKNLKLVPAPGSIAPDLLIAAGCVSETACVFISFEHLGLAPGFRKAAQSGAIKVLEMDGPGIAAGLRAGACDLPYGLIPDLGTDLPKVNPDCYRKARVQEGGRPLLEVPAIKPDVVLLHGQRSDDMGNLQYFGAGFFDMLLAQAADKVIATVDKLVPQSTVRSGAHLTKVPSALVDAVVVSPYGAHPGQSAGLYGFDEKHLKSYVRAHKSQDSFQAYLNDHVFGIDGERGYLDKIGVASLTAISSGKQEMDHA
ncbi:MAG: CoA transferase subunit A [Alphaproteobacteria bacterium]|jgi:glutaconate CoA-transferase, subunit A|nr:CoA transferase subunit A [Alphaproteobacteria bacterium]